MDQHENAFLDTLRHNPADDATRLVYADWLDEQDNDASTLKSVFLCLECRLLEIPVDTDQYTFLIGQRRVLAKQLDSKWLRIVCKVPIERCRMELEFAYECPKQWDQLKPTAKDNVRYCAACDNNVYYCTTLSDARWKGRFRCVAIDPRLLRNPDDLCEEGRLLMGRIAPPRRIPPLDE